MKFFLITMGLSNIYRILIEALFPLITGKTAVEIFQQSSKFMQITIIIFHLIICVNCVFLAKNIDQ